MKPARRAPGDHRHAILKRCFEKGAFWYDLPFYPGEFMRLVSCVLGAAFLAAVAVPTQAQDGFMPACLKTTSQKMCECISARLPPDKRQSAIEGLQKSNAATSPGGNLLDPSSLSQEQMQGLDAVVIAQANCMP
jgi:hypothetical protein